MPDNGTVVVPAEVEMLISAALDPLVEGLKSTVMVQEAFCSIGAPQVLLALKNHMLHTMPTALHWNQKLPKDLGEVSS